MKRIYLVRHGKTFINKYNKMQGWCDTPLTDEGREGAEKAAEALQELPLDIALSSNTLRASETCEIIMEKNCNRDLLQHLAYPYFREHFYGYFEGMDNDVAWRMVGAAHGFTNAADLAEHATCDQIADWTKEADPYHDAEDSKEFWARWQKGFDLIQ
ncbi:phosphoglycerate mutase family protein, partial [Lactobacillus delbrueckii]